MDSEKDTQAPGPDKATGEAANEETNWETKAQELEKQLAEAQKSLGRKEAEGKRNVQRLQSSLQSQITAANAEREAVEKDWRDRFDQQKMAQLSEEEALRYQNTRLAEQLDEQGRKLEQMQDAARNAQQAAQYIRHFAAQGIDAAKLNTAGSLQELYDSGTAAIEDMRADELNRMEQMQSQLKEYQEKLERFEQVNPDPNAVAQRQGDLQPPNVANVGANQASQERTMWEAREAAKQYFNGEVPTEEQLFRAVETGKLPPQVLPGLESMPKE